MKHTLAFTIALAVGATSFAASASAKSCYDLWYERNEVYATYGYCFKTKLARQVFGTSCSTKNPHLSNYDQKLVAKIRAQEISRGCKVNQ